MRFGVCPEHARRNAAPVGAQHLDPTSQDGPHAVYVDPLSCWSPRKALAIAAVLTVCVALFDIPFGIEANMNLLYVLPVALASWVAGAWGGVAIALLGNAAELVIHHATDLSSPTATHWWNHGVQIIMLCVVGGQLAWFHRLLERESRLATTDALTGLANRRAFYAAATREIERLRRHGWPLTLAMLDLDDFKEINDSRGHAAGDELLRRVAGVLCERLRSVDLAARLGGDEFALLLPETSQEHAERLTADLVERLASAGLRMLNGRGGVSLGAVTFESAPPGVDDALRAADKLLYEAKRQGKGRACHATYVAVALPGFDRGGPPQSVGPSQSVGSERLRSSAWKAARSLLLH